MVAELSFQLAIAETIDMTETTAMTETIAMTETTAMTETIAMTDRKLGIWGYRAEQNRW
jgi:putative ubiquitin-RnfH superfamily antitoxin RatB of RatAB toxin-antitoxin module